MGVARVSRPRRGRRAPMSEINVTPMVDVMLVLLIIFMVTAPLLASGVPVELPESQAKALAQEQKPVTITIDSASRVFLDEVEVAPGELPDRLADLPRNAQGELPQVTLRADRSINYGKLMEVMGLLNRAGFNSIALVTSAAPVSGGSPEAQ